MSDQDFFFEDDAVAEPAKGSDKVEKSKKADKPAKATAPVPSGAEDGIAITMTVVVLVAIIALLVGVIGGIFIGRSLAPTTSSSSTGSTGGSGMGGMGGGSMAPELTDDMMNQGMPEGHPDISNMGEAVEDAPDSDATGSE